MPPPDNNRFVTTLHGHCISDARAIAHDHPSGDACHTHSDMPPAATGSYFHIVSTTGPMHIDGRLVYVPAQGMAADANGPADDVVYIGAISTRHPDGCCQRGHVVHNPTSDACPECGSQLLPIDRP